MHQANPYSYNSSNHRGRDRSPHRHNNYNQRYNSNGSNINHPNNHNPYNHGQSRYNPHNYNHTNHSNYPRTNHSNHSNHSSHNRGSHSYNTHHSPSHQNRTHNNPRNRNSGHHNTQHSSHNSHNSHSHTNRTQHNSHNPNPTHYSNTHHTHTHTHHSQHTNRSRNIRNQSNSHSHNTHSHRPQPPIIPIVADTTDDIQIIKTVHKTHTNPTDILQTAMTELSFDTVPFKHDYKSKQNLSFLSVKNGAQLKRDKNAQNITPFNAVINMAMDPNTIHPWQYTNDTERKTKVRTYLLPCLRILNDIECMEISVDFIFAPHKRDSNPDYYQLFNSSKIERNMCLDWIGNLLRSDYYETVDDFANDMRLIWNNVYAVMGYTDIWGKNAAKTEKIFEIKMSAVSRHIPNAQSIFVANGNPTNDTLQQKFLEMEENKQEIIECLKKLARDAPKESVIEQKESMDSVSVAPKAKVKTAHQKYLSNIDTKKRNRKRATKQTLKPKKLEKPKMECEEGEIVCVTPKALSEEKMDLCRVWFEFLNLSKYKDTENIRRVIMIQEGFGTNINKFETYKHNLESRGSDLGINIGYKPAEIQCKIYEILDKAKSRVCRDAKGSMQVLEAMIEKRKNVRDRRAMIQSKHTRIEDPYSNKVIAEKRRREREAIEEQKRAAAMEEESEDEFDDRIYMGSSGGNVQGKYAQNINIVTNESSVRNDNWGLKESFVGKDDYGGNVSGYRPMRPANVDDDVVMNEDVDMDMERKDSSMAVPAVIEKVTSDNAEYAAWSYSAQQGDTFDDF